MELHSNYENTKSCNCVIYVTHVCFFLYLHWIEVGDASPHICNELNSYHMGYQYDTIQYLEEVLKRQCYHKNINKKDNLRVTDLWKTYLE